MILVIESRGCPRRAAIGCDVCEARSRTVDVRDVEDPRIAALMSDMRHNGWIERERKSGPKRWTTEALCPTCARLSLATSQGAA